MTHWKMPPGARPRVEATDHGLAVWTEEDGDQFGFVFEPEDAVNVALRMLTEAVRLAYLRGRPVELDVALLPIEAFDDHVARIVLRDAANGEAFNIPITGTHLCELAVKAEEMARKLG